MSDVPDGSGQIPRRVPRGDGGAPVSGALAIVLAVVAVVAGFLILRSISDGGESALDLEEGSSADDSSESGDGTDDDTADDTGTTVATLPPTTTEPALVVDGAVVLVANANGVGGSASQMSRALQVAGFTVIDPVNASSAVGDIDESRVYYDATNTDAQAVAESLVRVLGGDISVAPMPDPPPTDDGTLGEATVLLMLGNDKAGKTLAELAEDATDPVVATNPTIAGSSTTVVAGG